MISVILLSSEATYTSCEEYTQSWGSPALSPQASKTDRDSHLLQVDSLSCIPAAASDKTCRFVWTSRNARGLNDTCKKMEAVDTSREGMLVDMLG